jgi:hypothetical protein
MSRKAKTTVPKDEDTSTFEQGDTNTPQAPRKWPAIKWPAVNWPAIKSALKWPALKLSTVRWRPREWSSRKRVVVGAVAAVVLAAGVTAGVFALWPNQDPKSIAVAFARAIQGNDMAAARKVSTGSDEHYKTVEAVSQIFTAIRNYESAAVAKFGAAGRSKEMSLPDVVAETSGSQVRTEGDTATLINPKNPGDKNPMKLVKKGGKWYVDLASMPIDNQTRAMSASAATMKKALDETAAEIRAGRYKTPQEAQAALGTRMQAAVRAW